MAASDYLKGFGLPGNRHVSYQVTFEECLAYADDLPEYMSTSKSDEGTPDVETLDDEDDPEIVIPNFGDGDIQTILNGFFRLFSSSKGLVVVRVSADSLLGQDRYTAAD